MSDKVRIHLRNGRSYESPKSNLQNVRRLLGSKIARIEFLGEPEVIAPSLAPKVKTEVIELEAAGDVNFSDDSAQFEKMTRRELFAHLAEKGIETSGKETKAVLVKLATT